MILLDATTRSLEVKLAGSVSTNQLPFVCSYVDITTTSFTPGTTTGVTNNGTAVTCAAAPAASTQRQLKFLSVRNADTAAATATVQLNDNSTARTIVVFVLAVNDALIYVDGQGFKVFDANGQTKQSAIGSVAWGSITGTVSDQTDLGDSAVKDVGTTAGTVAAGDHNHTGVYEPASADFTSKVSAASDSAAGKVELATAAETTTGTDTGRAVTPDGLAGSVYGKRVVQIKVIDDATALTTGDGKVIFCIPTELNGYNLVDADAFVTTVSSSGAPSIMIRNVTDTADMLSTAITIDANETTSYTAATAPVIDGTKDDVVTGDLIAIDCDAAGTGAKGLGVILSFQLP
jgi:hypothetical protein